MKIKLKHLIFIILILFAVISLLIILKSFNKVTKNEENIDFKINKIICYTSANAISNTENLQENWELSIYQYTDFAIYIENLQNKKISELYIDNIEILKNPLLGEVIINRKNLNDFAKFEILESVSNDKIEYSVNEDINYSEEEIKPIVIGYVNNVKQNCIISDTSQNLEYNETLLKRAKILTEEIAAQISFNVNIVDENENKYVCNIILDIPIEELLNEQQKLELTPNLSFIREEK